MSSVKALPLGHIISSPMYVVMDSSHALKKNVHWPPPHEGSGQYKRPPHQPLPHSGGGGHHSPPLSGTRGYPYPQDPASRCSSSTTSYVTSASSSPHLAHPGGGAAYASANHVYRDNHFQVDGRQPAETHHIERYGDQHVQHARRRLSLRPAPTPEYNAALERDRYMDAIRYQYEREVALSVPYSPNALTARTLKPPVVSVHTPSEMDNVPQPMKRPRLAVEPKAPVHQPLLIDTRNVVIKKEPAYTPQVEAISPTLPPEEGRCESPMRLMKENILSSINRVDKEINQVESQITKLQRKVLELEAEESKPTVVKESVKDACPVELKQMSIAQIIYSENRSKAQESHSILEKLGPKVEIPMYNQPTDTAVYHENKRKHHIFRSRLSKYFKKKHREKSLRNKHLTDNYNKLLQEWLKKMEKKENNATKKAKDAKTREFFEKQFPELKKQREDKERISRVSTRIRSESEWEEIIDGLQEQEMEEKKMRSYAVIPPIILDSRQRRMLFDNRNGLVEDFSQEYKEKQMLNIWTDSEKEIFREKYLQHPKNFALIASCLERKTVTDCIQYYYLSKKGENYKQLLRKHNVRKRRTMVKPPQNQQTSGVTTRQQEDAKTSSLSSSSGPLVSACSTAPSETTTSSSQSAIATSAPSSTSTEGSCAVTTVTTTASSSPITTSTEVTTSTAAETTAATAPVPSCSSGGKLDKIPLPNNIRKKKEAALMMEEKEGARSDSDTASDHQNENHPAQPCVVCHMKLDNFEQSRVLTKSNCAVFGIKESELTPNTRVCASCRFKTVRKRCPIPTCSTIKRKIKRLRSLPVKWYELPKEAKEDIIAELQIPADITKCCSACHNRIQRKLENNSTPDSDLLETNSTNGWTDYEMNLAKQGLAEHGTDWEAVARVVGTKSKQQCRVFYFSYKRKLGLDEIIQEYKKSKKVKDELLSDGKPPPIVTDEEESGETTSSCDEDDRADRYLGSSDTASAPSPVDKILTEDKKDVQRPQPLGPVDPLLRDPSPKNDYDSSATVSADEGQNDGPSAPRILPPSKLAKTYHPPMKEHPVDVVRPLESSVPLVKTLLQDPKIGAATSQNADGSKVQTTCVRDLIFQAIEVSLNNNPLKPESPPVAHMRQPSRPSSHHMMEPPDCEVQDLSKKVKSRDVSPVRDFGGPKRERVVTPVRPPSGSSSMHYYGAPPPAHCNINMYRISQPPPPALSPHYVAEPPHDPYYRGGDSRGKAYLPPERPHSQPPHLVAQNSQNSVHAKPVPIKATNSVPPPPPLVASKPSSQMSPKMPPYKDRLIPSGSITQGTPVNQQVVPPPPPSSAQYQNFLRQLPPPHSKEGGGSITLGTPVQHDPSAVKRRPPEGFGPPESVPRPVMYDSQGMMEYYRQVAPGSQQYAAAFAPGGYPAGYPGTPRPPYANESQLSTKQIMIDFNTSKQMQMRRGGEKEMKVSPRGSDSSPAPPQPPPQENHLHPMYPPTSYGGGPPSHYNHVPGGYQQADSRYIHHRSSSTPLDRTRSPSGVESPLGYAPGKRSPSLAAGPAGRQNVIHRSITWGTAAKPSVIQATPQSAASPRTQTSADQQQRSDTVSPSVRKSTPSPRHHLLYPPSGHDAFNTLVNAAVAQPSLAVPTKDGKGGSPPDRAKSPRGGERPLVVVEGLEKTLMDMHQRPPLSKSYPSEHERPNEDGHRYPPFDPHRLSEKQQLLLNEQQSSTLRLGNMREPFSREQFERQMRQTSVSSAPPPRGFPNKKEEERCRSTEYPSPSPQQSDLDNEASKIFSQSFQKDAPRSNASPRGFTAANLIDAIITRQINQNVESTNVSKSSGMDLFAQYHSSAYDDSPGKPPLKSAKRTEIVTIDDEPDNDGKAPSWSSADRAPPVSSSSGPSSGYSGEKVYTLSEHIAAIISKDYNSPSESQPHFNSSSNNPVSAAPSRGFTPNKPEGMPDGPDHTAQNCPGNGCAYHSHSWKLRKALQQDRDHRPPSRQGEATKRPASNQNSDTAAPQEERQIIRVAQTSSPRTSPPTGPYGVEPISPPSQAESDPPPPATWNNPGIANFLASRHSMMQEYPPPESGMRAVGSHPPPSMAHYGPPTTSAGPNRHQQQMGLSPLDYVKNRIVEVMRTASDSASDPGTPRPPSAMSHTDEASSHALPPHPYRYTPTGSEPSPSGERPLSNGPPILQQGGPSQRYSPALSRYSPVPPRPSSAAERVPSRNSTPGEVPRPPHKRGSEDWRDGVSSRSVSPEGASSSKKTRSEGTFIPESTTDRAPVLLPQSLHRNQGGPPPSEAPRLSSNSLEPPKGLEAECYSKFRSSEVQWREGSEQPASSTTAEPFSPPSSTNRTDKGNSVTTTTTERSTPPTQQRSATSTPLGSTSSSYPSYVSSSTGGSALYSSASPSLPYSSFSGLGSTTYAYPYSALSMRNMNTTHTAIPPAVTNSSVSSSNSNSPSPRPRNNTNNQPPPLLSSQYEPLSDED